MKSGYSYRSDIAAGEYSRHKTDGLFGNFFRVTSTVYQETVPDKDLLTDGMIRDEDTAGTEKPTRNRITIKDLNDGIGLGTEMLREVEKTKSEYRNYI